VKVAEGLEQEFNSLHAQRDACEAYIASQTLEGWAGLRDRYDDGSFSGGTLERPALQRLLADIEAGLVEVVVVYKIDRLSRALMNFARLVEVFDRHGVVRHRHQSFNTTNSMGSPDAEYPAELCPVRARGHRRAPSATSSPLAGAGMWMGGFVPLGYDVKDRKLVVHETEAGTVRMIFERFAQIGSATMLVKALVVEGVLNKRGKPIDKGFLYKLLDLHRGVVAMEAAAFFCGGRR
jgi:DNA invertase Pin-like site-specific DNA recombinase